MMSKIIEFLYLFLTIAITYWCFAQFVYAETAPVESCHVSSSGKKICRVDKTQTLIYVYNTLLDISKRLDVIESNSRTQLKDRSIAVKHDQCVKHCESAYPPITDADGEKNYSNDHKERAECYRSCDVYSAPGNTGC